MYKIAPELKEVLRQLISEGYTVYSYEQGCEDGEINSLYWYENGRMLNIQPSTWRDRIVFRDRYNISTGYVPSSSNGTGCRLSTRDGIHADELLSYRNEPTWVRGYTNWKSLEHWLKHQTVLDWFQVTVWHLLYEGE